MPLMDYPLLRRGRKRGRLLASLKMIALSAPGGEWLNGRRDALHGAKSS